MKSKRKNLKILQNYFYTLCRVSQNQELSGTKRDKDPQVLNNKFNSLMKKISVYDILLRLNRP